MPCFLLHSLSLSWFLSEEQKGKLYQLTKIKWAPFAKIYSLFHWLYEVGSPHPHPPLELCNIYLYQQFYLPDCNGRLSSVAKVTEVPSADRFVCSFPSSLHTTDRKCRHWIYSCLSLVWSLSKILSRFSENTVDTHYKLHGTKISGLR